MNKILSIVISSKNNEICLLNLIKQIISNSNFLTSFDLYIINDASTTDYSKVEEYINKNPEIKYYVNKTPQGKVRSIVNHTKFLSSQYLVFIDDKDKILPLF
ncbi:glycosyltransferase family 2 protein [bacterium]|nr:glycosyltransferase family 2 protein [bacterium]